MTVQFYDVRFNSEFEEDTMWYDRERNTFVRKTVNKFGTLKKENVSASDFYNWCIESAKEIAEDEDSLCEDGGKDEVKEEVKEEVVDDTTEDIEDVIVVEDDDDNDDDNNGVTEEDVRVVQQYVEEITQDTPCNCCHIKRYHLNGKSCIRCPCKEFNKQ